MTDSPTDGDDVASSRIAIGVGLLALSSVPFLYRLGAWPLIEPDEGRNAEVAREMLLLGSWSVPHFNLLPYLDKPVLLFWLIAATFRIIGESEMGARLPAALAGIATVVLTAVLGRCLFDVRREMLGVGKRATSATHDISPSTAQGRRTEEAARVEHRAGYRKDSDD